MLASAVRAVPRLSLLFVTLLVALVLAAPTFAQPGGVIDWKREESPLLRNHVQLTLPEQFLKAGESYFSPDDSKIIFQAVAVPAIGEPAERYYQMYVADVVRDRNGKITGLANHKRLSPPGSSNTCGWFHPTKPNTVIFGSTLVPPTDPDVAGYQRGSSRYKWQFPKEMTIVECNLDTADGSIESLKPILSDSGAYLAECSLTKDGRHLLFCRYAEKDYPSGGNLYVKDLESDQVATLIDAEGYDGGPFFSPDEKRICYRSDRRGNNELQLFMAELVYDRDGRITGTTNEVALTDNEHVNWAPFWDPEGRELVYATSEEGHFNYEVYAINTRAPGGRHEASKRRITHAGGFDGLPVFDSTGDHLMWTSQRDASGTSQVWVAELVKPMD